MLTTNVVDKYLLESTEDNSSQSKKSTQTRQKTQVEDSARGSMAVPFAECCE